jgi:hypothetical protein
LRKQIQKEQRVESEIVLQEELETEELIPEWMGSKEIQLSHRSLAKEVVLTKGFLLFAAMLIPCILLYKEKDPHHVIARIPKLGQ